MPSFFIAFIPLLAADSRPQAARRSLPDSCRCVRFCAHDQHQLGFRLPLNLRNTAHSNDRLSPPGHAGRAQICALEIDRRILLAACWCADDAHENTPSSLPGRSLPHCIAAGRTRGEGRLRHAICIAERFLQGAADAALPHGRQEWEGRRSNEAQAVRSEHRSARQPPLTDRGGNRWCLEERRCARLPPGDNRIVLTRQRLKEKLPAACPADWRDLDCCSWFPPQPCRPLVCAAVHPGLLAHVAQAPVAGGIGRGLRRRAGGCRSP